MLYVLLVIVQILGGSLEAAVLNVNPADSLEYQTIGAALGACSRGDTVMLAPGTYSVGDLKVSNSVAIIGLSEGGAQPHLIGEKLTFRDEILLQNLTINASIIHIAGLYAFILDNCITVSSIMWLELSKDIHIVNNEFINTANVNCYGVDPEIAFNTFRCDSLHGQGTALHYMNGPGLVPHINIHHNSFINYRNAIELDWPCQPSCKGDFTVDLSDNWWGVTDTAAILALSGESEMGDIGAASIEYKMDSFLDTPPGSLGYVADSVYGLSYNTFEDISHAVVISTYSTSIEDKDEPGLNGSDRTADQFGAAVYLSIDGSVITDRSRLGKGVYIQVQENAVKKVLLLKK